MHPGDVRSVEHVTAAELIHAYEVAREALRGVPHSSTVAELTPEQAAGALVEEHGLAVAAMLARSRVDLVPASWEFEFLTWQLLDSAQRTAAETPAPAVL